MLTHDLELYVHGVLVFTYIREPDNFTMNDVVILIKERDRRDKINNIIGVK